VNDSCANLFTYCSSVSARKSDDINSTVLCCVLLLHRLACVLRIFPDGDNFGQQGSTAEGKGRKWNFFEFSALKLVYDGPSERRDDEQ